MVHDHILQRGAGLRERGAGLRVFINAGRPWIIAYHEPVAITGALPGKERRAEFEKLTPPIDQEDTSRLGPLAVCS